MGENPKIECKKWCWGWKTQIRYSGVRLSNSKIFEPINEERETILIKDSKSDYFNSVKNTY